jgi:2-polyprenyl-6-methoxyphenol hydroxylase-like FAD-dependent oxidoreductase
LDVCIRGGGIVGHALALGLARERLRVGLVVRPATASPAPPDVRAYALNHQSRDLLEQLRCWPGPTQATPVLSMQVREAGAGAVSFSATESSVPALAWIVDVPALEAQMAEALRFQPQVECIDTPQDALLTVVCEGQSSASREDFGAELDVTPYPHWAIAARVLCEQAHGQTACQWFTPGDVLGFLPLGGESGNSMAIVWSVSQERKAVLLGLDPAAFTEQLQLACGNRFGALSLSSARAAWPLRLAVARNWCGVTAGQSWVLAGDAAHAVHPLAGQGLNLGLADVAELVRQLHERDSWRPVSDVRILRNYERARKAEVALMGNTTDGLQLLFGRDGAWWKNLRNWGMEGFERSGPIKRWVARQAMGHAGARLGLFGADKTL